MKTDLKAFDYLKPHLTPDKALLTGLLDFLFHKRICNGYSFVFVPQLGEDQGHAVRFSRFRKSVPKEVRSECLRITATYDIAHPTRRNLKRSEVLGYDVSFCSIASSYDINIGAVSLASRRRISRRDFEFILNTFESFISLRKKAVAFTHHGEFLQIDQNERAALDHAVGNIVHQSVNPHETLIFAPDQDNSRYKVSYSSKGTNFSVLKGHDPLSRCFDVRQPITINDTFDKTTIVDRFGADITNREFVDHSKYLSCIFVPVWQGSSCYCVIACFFSRKNAVSETERDILTVAATILGDYYRLWTERNLLQSKIRENDRIYYLVRQSLLIADIMHDASEDLTTARGQIGLINARNDFELRALTAAKDSMRELINASRHFRTFFSTKSKDAKVDGNISRKIRTITAADIFGDVNIFNLVEEIKLKYEMQLQLYKITLKNSCSKSLEIRASKYNLKKAIDNAVKNSIAHLRDKTHVKREIVISMAKIAAGVKSSLPEEHVEIAISDNGSGVEPENLNRVLEPFFSLRGGMGLGLPIIQAACEAHGGRVDVSSDWGKEFKVTMSIPT
jgi:signal transduction histidine kinase